MRCNKEDSQLGGRWRGASLAIKWRLAKIGWFLMGGGSVTMMVEICDSRGTKGSGGGSWWKGRLNKGWTQSGHGNAIWLKEDR